MYHTKHRLTCPRADRCGKMHQGCCLLPASGELGGPRQAQPRSPPQPGRDASYWSCGYSTSYHIAGWVLGALPSLHHSSPVFGMHNVLGEAGVKLFPTHQGRLVNYGLLARQALLQIQTLRAASRDPSTGNEKPW